MSSPSEIKLLRDELARVIAEVKKRDAALEQLRVQNEQLRIEVEQLKVQNEQLRGQLDKGGGRISYYENPHSPPSANSIPERQKKKASRKDPADYKKPGRRPGHRGVSHGRRSQSTIHHVPGECRGCGSGRLGAGRIADMRQVTDVPPAPKAATVSHVAHDGVCGRCGRVTEAPSLYGDGVGVAVRGTSLGPVLVSRAVQMWEKHVSASGITDILNDAFGIELGRAAVQGALAAAGRALQAERDGIAGSLGGAPNLKADETTYGFLHGGGYVWTVIGGDSVVVHASPSRAGVVMDRIAPYRDKPLTCDGYSGYNEYATRQRCWAHILRESGALAREHGETFPELAALHGSLARLYHGAKLARRGPGGPEVDTKPMEAAATVIARRFGLHAAGATFATKLANAAPFLFTFVNLPGVDPTNNESERMLRKVVIARKIRFRIASLEGARTFSNIMTCMLTWRKRNLNVSDMLLKVLSGT